jgi:hypothetical protein
VGRKILANQGEVLAELLGDIQATADELIASDGQASLGQALKLGVEAGAEARQWLLDHAGENRDVAGAVSVNMLMLLGYVCGGWVMGRSALKAGQLLAAGSGDESFLKAKMVTAEFYCEHLLPRAHACLITLKAGSNSMMALSENQF